MKIFKALAVSFVFSGVFLMVHAQESEPFFEGENAVGYIKDTSGNKYIVIETPDGRAKLIKTRKNPEEILQDSYGISNKDFQIR
ncbi:hypothetical protein [Persephonella sp. KM09-Lau-8]|uniref:hypothetical protein n=1 Tax=Persephonella sp. KM09-Lau-8 TaxID=1158345 RepID=UPI000689336E|nr:hypothetical protein [Persephonella sp. KM09-Lau-8]